MHGRFRRNAKACGTRRALAWTQNYAFGEPTAGLDPITAAEIGRIDFPTGKHKT